MATNCVKESRKPKSTPVQGQRVTSPANSPGGRIRLEKTRMSHRRRTASRITSDSAAWGGRLLLLILLCLSATHAFADYKSTTYTAPSGTLYQYLSAAARAKVSPDLWSLPLTGTANVIVRWTSKPTSTQENQLKGKGARVRNRLNVIQATAFSNVPVYLIAYGAGISSVAYISSDRPVKMSGTVVPLTSAANLFPAAAVDADLAWNGGWDGSGVGVALIDSGVKSHPDLNNKLLNSRVVYSEDFTTNEDTQGDAVTDFYGHGTHVAGIMAGNAASVGYNPQVR